MKAIVTPISKTEMAELVAAMERPSLDDRGKAIYDRCVAATTQMWAGFANKHLVCVWGLIPPTLLSDQAYLWLYTTDAVKDHEFIFVRQSQIAVKEMLKMYPVIVGHVEVGMDRSVRWIKWLGAVFGDPQGKLIPFTIRSE